MLNESIARPRSRRRKDSGSVWARRESEWNARCREVRRAEVYAYLQSEVPETDKILIGWPAITQWMNDHGFRGHYQRREAPMTAETVRCWARRLKLPYTRGRPALPGLHPASHPMTTAHALLAWALSLYRTGGLTMPTVRLPDERQ